MNTVEIDAGLRGYFFASIGELLEQAKIAPSYEEAVKLADTGKVEIVSDNFPRAVVGTHREMVCFAEWCDVSIDGKVTKVVVSEAAY